MAESARESKAVTLLDRSVADALRSWAAPLGCPVAFLESPRTRSLTRVEPDDRCIRTFVRGDVAVVSLPCPDAIESERDLEPIDVDDLLAMTQDDAPLGAASTASNKVGKELHRLKQRRQPWQISNTRSSSVNSFASS